MLLELPLILLVEKNSRIASVEQLWQRDKITEPLICLPPGESLCKNFQQKLCELGVDWFPGIEASSADLIETYVASGLGIGVSVAIPKKTLPPKLVEQIKSNEIELKTQQDTLQVRKKQASTINAKYDEDKRRYLELTRGKAGAQAASTPAPPKK